MTLSFMNCYVSFIACLHFLLDCEFGLQAVIVDTHLEEGTYADLFWCHHDLLLPLVLLQVGLWKSLLKQKPEEGCFVSEQRAVGLQSIVQEVGLLHHSRGWLLEDALRCSQRLEQELWSSRETVVALQREQLSMRKKVEEARQALRISLGKVKDLEVKARDVPALQRYILQLKSEMLCQR